MAAPGQPTVAGPLHDVDFMVKDSKRFADGGGWGYAAFKYDAAANSRTRLARQGTVHLKPTMQSAGSPATPS